ncbi:hypothetical protein A0J61_11562, partial [Choanephora cucurbitarum]
HRIDYPTYIALFNYITRKTYPLDSTESIKASLRKKAHKFIAYRGRLYEKTITEDDQDCLGRELLHEGTIEPAISRIHSEGHFGVTNTWKKVQLRYTGKKIYEKVVDCVKNCPTCQARQRIPHLKVTPGFIIPTPSRPFYLVGTDCIGPLEPTPSGNKYIMVASCYLTRWPIALAVPDITAETTERFLMDQIISFNYMAEYLQVALRKIECTHRKTTSRRPNSNGHVERLNQTLIQTMAKLRRDDENKPWDEYLTAALMCIRTMTNEATGYSPSMLLYGEMHDEIARRTNSIEEWVQELRQEARNRSEKKKKARKAIYDKSVVPRPPFKINDKVLMKDHYPKDKFADHYIGPLTVIKHNAPTNTYHLIGPNYRRIEHAVHGDILLPFHESKRMIPDVIVTRAMNQFQSWLDRQRYD